jgi:hypothetical protein
VPANLYLRATVVVKADFTDLPDPGNDWQDVYAHIPFQLFEKDDVLADLCPSFLVGGIARQETPIGDTDNWGLALDQGPGRPPRVVPPPFDIDAWWQDTQDQRFLVVQFRIRNRGRSQMSDVCLAFDALVYRANIGSLDGPAWRSARFSRSAVRAGDL